MIRLLIFLCLSLALAGCNFKPRYCRPCMDMPACWRFDANLMPNDEANFRWWEGLNDPVLNELIATALINNQDLLAATERVLQFYDRYRIVASRLYPEIDLDASYTRQGLSEAIDYSPVAPQFRYNNLYAIALNLSYEIDIWGKIRNASEAALSQYLGEIEARRTVILTLVSSLASAYIQLRQFDSQLLISKLTYNSRVEALKIATARYNVGLVSEMEVMQAESEADSALVSVKTYEELIPQQEDLICVLLGYPSYDIPRGRILEDFTTPPDIPMGLPSEILLNRPDIIQAELKLIAANAEIGVARAAFFPTFNLSALYGAESTSLSNLFNNIARMWNVSIGAMQPIFTGWRLTYQLKEAEAIFQEAVFNYRQTILQALQEVNDSLIAYQKTQEIVAVQKEQVKSLAVYLKLAFLRYDNGQNDYLTVLDAERSLFRVQLDLAQSEANVFLAFINLYRSLGGGWVVDADNALTTKALD